MVVEGQNNMDTVYDHFLLVEKVDKGCFDSILAMTILDKYLDTLTTGKPAWEVRIFKSDKSFDIGETYSQPKKIYKDCLADISLDSLDHPYEFTFYNSSGEKCYNGPRWMPVN